MAWGWGWGWGGLFLSFGRPTQEQRKSCLAAAGGFNYEAALHGASRPNSESKSAATLADDDESLSERGFLVNRSRVQIGSGAATLVHAKSALLSWRHLALGWAHVEAETPVKAGTRFCICYKEVIPCCWVMLPLQIAYVSSTKAMFAFGSGTLQGHLLAGEERFSVHLDEEDRVWYEVLSFSKPAHILSTLCYPYVKLRQKHFAHKSGQALLRLMTAADPNQIEATPSSLALVPYSAPSSQPPNGAIVADTRKGNQKGEDKGTKSNTVTPDSPAMGTRSKKKAPDSPAMGTRSKKKLLDVL